MNDYSDAFIIIVILILIAVLFFIALARRTFHGKSFISAIMDFFANVFAR